MAMGYAQYGAAYSTNLQLFFLDLISHLEPTTVAYIRNERTLLVMNPDVNNLTTLFSYAKRVDLFF